MTWISDDVIITGKPIINHNYIYNAVSRLTKYIHTCMEIFELLKITSGKCMYMYMYIRNNKECLCTYVHVYMYVCLYQQVQGIHRW